MIDKCVEHNQKNSKFDSIFIKNDKNNLFDSGSGLTGLNFLKNEAYRNMLAEIN